MTSKLIVPLSPTAKLWFAANKLVSPTPLKLAFTVKSALVGVLILKLSALAKVVLKLSITCRSVKFTSPVFLTLN